MSDATRAGTGGVRGGIEPVNYIGDDAVPAAGDDIVVYDPAAPDRLVFSCAELDGVDDAVAAARRAFEVWSDVPIERRAEVLLTFRDLAKAAAEEIAQSICDETGKALWDCRAEAGLLAAKVDITLDESGHSGRRRVMPFEFDLAPGKRARADFKPHGVLAVIGPFNFPAHLPNGHIVPALLMGNCVVFKPSDKTPRTGQLLAALFRRAFREHGLPLGVVNMVQGRGRNAAALVAHPSIDGVLFTGSWAVGRRILEANLDRPSRIVALEMGGNNPSIVLDDADIEQAAIEIVRTAFITTGQRCTCTRRLVVHAGVADAVLGRVVEIASGLVIAPPREEPCFYGPIVSEQARQDVFEAQDRYRDAGGRVLLESKIPEGLGRGWYLTPGIIEVPGFVAADEPGHAGADAETFGPLLRVCRVASIEAAIEQANATRFGLSAAVFTASDAAADRVFRGVRAGCINRNTGTAGASSKLPFGGLGLSGNHRPAGAFSLDYCAYPVARMLNDEAQAAVPQGMRV